MTKFYSAKFADGTKIVRTSTSERTYSHAWMVKISGRKPDQSEIEHNIEWAKKDPVRAAKGLAYIEAPRTETGFSSSAVLAHKAADQTAAAWTKSRHISHDHKRTILGREVVEVTTHASRTEAKRA